MSPKLATPALVWRLQPTAGYSEARHGTCGQLSTHTRVGHMRSGTFGCYKSGHRWEARVFAERHRRHVEGFACSDQKTITVI